MGRQIAIVATREDEQEFLSFVREISDIAIIEYFAKAVDEIWVESFATDYYGHLIYHIWNRKFPWVPEYARIAGDAPVVEHRGWYYIGNTGTAPIIEFSRCDLNAKPTCEGRIYWSKYFSAPDGLAYDVGEFEKWYDTIVRSIRKHGKKVQAGAYTPYYLPDAARKFL